MQINDLFWSEVSLEVQSKTTFQAALTKSRGHLWPFTATFTAVQGPKHTLETSSTCPWTPLNQDYCEVCEKLFINKRSAQSVAQEAQGSGPPSNHCTSFTS